MPLSIAVLVSGSGSNLQSLIEHIERGVLDAKITTVISNVPDAYGLIRAQNHNIPSRVVSHRDFPEREGFDEKLAQAVRESGAQAVVLAGFMRILTPTFLDAFPNRVINIHPAILPSFPGIHGQHQAADYGVRIAGCTVHLVDHKVDHGPIIIQAALPVRQQEDGDSLAGRILELEHRILPQAVQWLATGRLFIQGRQVRIAPAEVDPAEDGGCGNFLISPPLEQGF
ncbi:MAG: phosphoribosylglycinamide formyltransferase [Desulfovibrionales bacterium]